MAESSIGPINEENYPNLLIPTYTDLIGFPDKYSREIGSEMLPNLNLGIAEIIDKKGGTWPPPPSTEVLKSSPAGIRPPGANAMLVRDALRGRSGINERLNVVEVSHDDERVIPNLHVHMVVESGPQSLGNHHNIEKAVRCIAALYQTSPRDINAILERIGQTPVNVGTIFPHLSFMHKGISGTFYIPLLEDSKGDEVQRGIEMYRKILELSFFPYSSYEGMSNEGMLNVRLTSLSEDLIIRRNVQPLEEDRPQDGVMNVVVLVGQRSLETMANKLHTLNPTPGGYFELLNTLYCSLPDKGNSFSNLHDELENKAKSKITIW